MSISFKFADKETSFDELCKKGAFMMYQIIMQIASVEVEIGERLGGRKIS